MQKPTAEQYQNYRATRRLAVKRIVDCVQSGTLALNEWSRGVITRSRAEHSASISRQNVYGEA